MTAAAPLTQPKETEPHRNCPFYGFHMFRPDTRQGLPFVLIASHGNQCAMIHDSHAPCLMEQDGLLVDWRGCPRVAEIRIGGY